MTDEREQKKGDPSSIAARQAAGRPLAGKSILVTRPRDQAGEMIALLEGFGATVLHLPMIEVKEPESWDALDEAIRQLRCYDWILFTSINGVNYFSQRLRQARSEALASVTAAHICAIGNATAQALESAGVEVDLIATDSKAEGLLRSLVDHVGGAKAVGRMRFLIPRAQIAREVLPEELRKLGAQVDAVAAYQNVLPESGRKDLLGLLRQGSIDAITFTSSSTVKNFMAVAGGEDLADLLQDILIACIGPVTAATAYDYRLKRII